MIRQTSHLMTFTSSWVHYNNIIINNSMKSSFTGSQTGAKGLNLLFIVISWFFSWFMTFFLSQFSPHLNFLIFAYKKFSLFVSIWRFKMVTYESKSCSYCLLSRQGPHQNTKHLIIHLRQTFLEGHLPLTIEQIGRLLGNISQQEQCWSDGGSGQLVAAGGVFRPHSPGKWILWLWLAITWEVQ